MTGSLPPLKQASEKSPLCWQAHQTACQQWHDQETDHPSPWNLLLRSMVAEAPQDRRALVAEADLIQKQGPVF